MSTREQAVRALQDFGCNAGLVALVHQLSEDRAVVVKVGEGSGEFLPVAAGLDCEAAWYAERHRFYVAVDPDRGRHYQALTQCAVAEKNGRTWRLTMPVAAAQDPPQQRHWVAALESLRRSEAGPARSGSARGSANVCPTCRQELPVNGMCDEHGRPA